MNIEDRFNKTKPIIAMYAMRFSKATNIPVEEYESALCEEFAEKAEKYDGRIPFTSYIKPKLNQRAMRVAERKERRFYDSIVHAESIVDEQGNVSFEFADSIDVAEIAVNNIEISPDKLPLIRALMEKADDFTVAAVDLILSNPNASLNSIATEMGVQLIQLKRKLKHLAKNYDQARFGDISQYLAS